jgi:hypothetical protein
LLPNVIKVLKSRRVSSVTHVVSEKSMQTVNQNTSEMKTCGMDGMMILRGIFEI